jgi:hypothetical protein
MKSRMMRWAGHLARTGEKGNIDRVFVGNPEGKRSLGRLRRRWQYYIKIDLREIEKSSDLIGIRTRELPAFSIVPQPTTLPRAPEIT